MKISYLKILNILIKNINHEKIIFKNDKGF
jgi:hypothetical protein